MHTHTYIHTYTKPTHIHTYIFLLVGHTVRRQLEEDWQSSQGGLPSQTARTVPR